MFIEHRRLYDALIFQKDAHSVQPGTYVYAELRPRQPTDRRVAETKTGWQPLFLAALRRCNFVQFDRPVVRKNSIQQVLRPHVTHCYIWIAWVTRRSLLLLKVADFKGVHAG
jgi:hypothetical protein